MSADQKSFILFCCLCLAVAIAKPLIKLWRGAIFYRKTRKELDRYLAELDKAVEARDDEGFKRWESRIEEVVEYAKERVDRM